MAHEYIATASELKSWLEDSIDDRWLAIDTEFISECRSESQLCLIQVAGPRGLALVDPIAIEDVSPFWKRLCHQDTMILVHACRCEMDFCWRAAGQIPKNVFDIQIASGFVSSDYPASFKLLGERLLHADFAKQESRTRWNRRPLSALQVEYALGDVRYLNEMAITLREKLVATGRLAWFREEMKEFLQSLANSFSQEPWAGFRGLKNLTRRELAIVREIWTWRRDHSLKTNSPPRRVLRDDLIVELARRQSDDPTRIEAVRGLGSLKKYYGEIAYAINRGLNCPVEQLPVLADPVNLPQYATVSQFLMTALAGFAHEHNIASSLLVSGQDIREYIAFASGHFHSERKPRLLRSWRAELVGPFLNELLSGHHALVIRKEEGELVVRPVSSDRFR